MIHISKARPKTGFASDGRPMHYSVGAIIEDTATGEFLMLNRRFPPPGYAGMAGHIDEGEDPLDALYREGKEELGVELLDARFLCEREMLWNSCWQCDAHYWYLYRAKVERPLVRIDPHEAKDWGWFSRAQLRALALESVWEYWLKQERII